MGWDGIPEHWGKGQYRDVPISKFVRMCRERQVRDLQRWIDRDPSFPFYYDQEEADRAVWFFSMLRHFDGEFAGQPFILSDWQEWDIIRPLFGWKRLDGTRRFRKAYIEIARGNGKSMLSAGIGAYLLMADREHGAQVYAAATKEDQAKIVWGAAKRSIEKSRELRNEVRCVAKTLICDELGSVFRPIGRDSDAQDGFSVHGGIIDEYHAHKTDEMLEVLSSGTVKRRQPLITIITTAGFNTTGPCKKESDYAKKLLEGGIENEQYLCFVATVDDPERWDDEEEWFKANPNMGISVYLDTFRGEFEEAKAKASKLYSFKTKNLNIWCGEVKKWISISEYAKGDGHIDWERFRGKRCFAGLDLGQTKDISALCLAFMDPPPDKAGEGLSDIYLLMKYWVPEEGLYRRHQEDGVPYPAWRDQGWLSVTPGNATRYDIVRRDIRALGEMYEIAEIAADPYNAHELLTNLADDGFTVQKHPQTMLAMNFPCRSFEELILQARLKNGDDPVLRWMVSNAVVVMDGNGNIKVVKDKSTDRVDGVVAACMAIGRLLIAPEPTNFVYNLRGMYVG